MKKKLIAAGAASLAAAAMPVVGVFAAPSSIEFTDNLSVSVDAGCTLENGGTSDGVFVDRSFSKNIAVGNYEVLESAGTEANDNATMTIKCNTTSGTVTVTYKVNGGESTALAGPASASIPASAVVTGPTSGWAIKSNATNASTDTFAGAQDTTVADASNYVAPSSAEGTFLTSTASASGTTFKPTYRVYVAQGQAVGNYTGSVTYTIGYTGSGN